MNFYREGDNDSKQRGHFRVNSPDKASAVSYRTNSTKMRLTQQNLQQLKSNVGSLHESDIFKICVKTL